MMPKISLSDFFHKSVMKIVPTHFYPVLLVIWAVPKDDVFISNYTIIFSAPFAFVQDVYL